MAGGQRNPLLRHLRRVVDPGAAGGPTDAQLLERFVQGRDEAAFELLVWRHGAMVRNVCLRVLRREHDAEDAFQATFLTLARKASAIGQRASVGSWLYKVAYRVALRAGTATPSQPLPQGPLRDASATEPVSDLLWREWRAALDEEVNRLPDKYRVAFVLCQLEGQTTEAAARTLDCPPGTVGTRLARARALLRRRLTRRGFDLSALIVSRNVVAALPAALVDSTVRAALLGTVDKAVAHGVISARVAALTKGALRTMSLTKWTVTTAAVLALSLLGGGAALLAHRAQAVEPAPVPAVEAAPCPPDDPKQKAAGVTLRWKFEKDKPFYQEVTNETTQTLKVMDNDVTQKQKQTFLYRWTPKQQVRDKSWVLTQKFEGVKLDIDIGSNRIQFDSTKEIAANNPLAEFYKALVGAEFQFVLDKGYKVKKVEGRDEFVKKLASSNPASVAVLDQVLSEDALRQAAEPLFAALREGPVRPGDSWTRKSKLDMGPLGEYENRFKYTYKGKDDKDKKLDRIEVESSLKFLGPGAVSGAVGLPYKVKNTEIKNVVGNGIILFDRSKGRIVCLELNQKMEGKLAITIGGQDTPVEFAQTQKTTLKTTDTNPLKRTKPQRDDPKEVERLRQENERLKRQLRAVEEALRREGKLKP
jgi:RNA polymerase sigma factor (sigma-70 family)